MNKLREIGLENLPEKYKEIAKKKILTDEEDNFRKSEV